MKDKNDLEPYSEDQVSLLDENDTYIDIIDVQMDDLALFTLYWMNNS